jgi:hypothetical protein
MCHTSAALRPYLSKELEESGVSDFFFCESRGSCGDVWRKAFSRNSILARVKGYGGSRINYGYV